MSKVILITGAAGFIGFHTCIKFLKDNFNVIGLDNINSYYDINLKKRRNFIKRKKKLELYKERSNK